MVVSFLVTAAYFCLRICPEICFPVVFLGFISVWSTITTIRHVSLLHPLPSSTAGPTVPGWVCALVNSRTRSIVESRRVCTANLSCSIYEDNLGSYIVSFVLMKCY